MCFDFCLTVFINMVCKVAPKLSSPSHRSNTEVQDGPNQVADYETALDSAGYGRFSISVLGACSCAFFTTGVQNGAMSYVLPASRCDLQLTTYQTGLVNMAFMCGGVASAFFWGIVGDVFGRRNILSFTLLLDSSILFGQSMVNDYRLLLVARSINGFLIGGPSTLVFTYLSDLVGAKRRQFYLNITGLSFIAAWLILPAYAWLLIPLKLTDYATLLPINSWRLFLAISSLPGFLSGFWILCLPESPRLLNETNRSDKALKILAHIHRVNNGKSSEYKIKKLIPDSLVAAKRFKDDENRTKDLFVGVLKDLKTLVSKRYATKSSLIMFVFFANMAAGFGLTMWIPELLLRVEGRDCTNASSLPESAKLFNASNTAWKDITRSHDGYTRNHFLDDSSTDGRLVENQPCDDTISNEVFISGLIVGACCVAGGALAGAGRGAVGVRRAAAACALLCAAACLCLAASVCSCATSSKVAVAASAVLNAASLNGNVLLIRLLLFALPAKLSGLGVCWGAWWGRAGGVLSNMAVGALLDVSCPAPFLAVAAVLAVSIAGIMVIKLENVGESKGPENKEDQEIADKTITLDRYISTHI